MRNFLENILTRLETEFESSVKLSLLTSNRTFNFMNEEKDGT